MGLLSLILNVRANTDDARRKLTALNHKVTQDTRFMMKNFRTAFTTFFSVSAMRTMVLQTMQWAKNFENIREEVKGLGVSIDENALKKAQYAEGEWRAFLYELRAGMLTWLPALTDLFSDIAFHVAKVGAMLGIWWEHMRDVTKETKDQREEVEAMYDIYDRSPGMMGHGSGFHRAGIRGRGTLADINTSLDRAVPDIMSEFARMEDERAKRKADREAWINEEQARLKAAMNKRPEVAAALLPGILDRAGGMAAIGGFRSTGSMQSQVDISRRQLVQLEAIKGNTDSLKGGVL